MTKHMHRGYTLVELVVATGLFALVMLLASGAYFIMISTNRQAQSVVLGIDNLGFALETMTRLIRTGSDYSCAGLGDCSGGASSFSFERSDGTNVTYSLSGGSIQQTIGGVSTALTDSSVNVTDLTFYVHGSGPRSIDSAQARVTMVVRGTVASGPGQTEAFSVEAGATMRGSDI